MRMIKTRVRSAHRPMKVSMPLISYKKPYMSIKSLGIHSSNWKGPPKQRCKKSNNIMRTKLRNTEECCRSKGISPNSSMKLEDREGSKDNFK